MKQFIEPDDEILNDEKFWNESEISNIIDSFDFEEAHTIAEKMNWIVVSENGFEIPSISRMKETAKSLLTHLQQKTDVSMINTARFVAIRKRNDELELFYGISSA